MALVTSAFSHTSHPRHIEPSSTSNNLTGHLSWSSPKSIVSAHIPVVAPSISCKRTVLFRCRAESNVNGLGTNKAKRPKPLIPRKDWFPRDFIFGASSSAYQIEGAWNECDRGPSVWDHFCHNYPERIKGRANGDHAVNSYRMYKEDVRMLKEMGMDAYRFSISWSRILPRGTIQGGINKKGIKYYRNLIDTLKENGIEPYVTIFHWDTPQALQDMYGGFLDRRIVDHYKDFARVCFEHFGDKVKHWFTFNEPYIFSCFSFGTGQFAPGRCSPGQDCALPSGNSLTEPYIVGHHLLLAHAEAFHLYKKHFQGNDGHIGLALVSDGYVPYDATSFLDKQAKERCIDYNLGWFLEPVFRGDYPFSMRSLIGDRLPYFTDEEKNKLVGSYNMLGLNYYNSMFAKNIDISPKFSPKLNKDDAYAEITMYGPDGNLIGPNTGLIYLNSYPEGLKDLLMIIKEKYGNPPVYITENGTADIDNGDLPMEVALHDTTRLKYLQDHISVVHESIKLGANVRGHFTWSLLDNFEWASGYAPRFGLIYVDREDKFKRHMKKSAKWFAEFNRKSHKEIMDNNDLLIAPTTNEWHDVLY